MSMTIQWINTLAAWHIYVLHRTQAQQKKNLVTLLRQLQPLLLLQHLAKVTLSGAALTFCVWCVDAVVAFAASPCCREQC